MTIPLRVPTAAGIGNALSVLQGHAEPQFTDGPMALTSSDIAALMANLSLLVWPEELFSATALRAWYTRAGPS
jgi:hypothetical protein